MKYLLMALVLAVVFAVSTIPVWASPQYADYVVVHSEDPVAQDPSMFGDYDTDIKAHTKVGLVMAAICRIATPRDAEFIYAPSESLFKASGGLQLWGCPNANGATFQAARERWQEWKDSLVSIQPLMYLE